MDAYLLNLTSVTLTLPKKALNILVESLNLLNEAVYKYIKQYESKK
jgi:predicted transcriptional regulator YheO